jgi:hypothetical protein
MMSTVVLAVLAVTWIADDCSGMIWHRQEHIIAAKEIRRYIYASTGHWLDLVDGDKCDLQTIPTKTKQLVVLATQSDPELIEAKWHDNSMFVDLSPQSYYLLTVKAMASQCLLVVGSDDVGVLYGAYALARKFGVYFRLYGRRLISVIMLSLVAVFPGTNLCSGH